MADQPKDVDPSSSPKAFFGAELRRAREAAGLSQEKLGEHVFCSGSYIGQIEMATRKPQPDLAERIDAVLGTGGLFTRMCAMVNTKRLAEYFAEVAELEATAVTIGEYAPTLVPGLLQTKGYARAVFRAAQPFSSAEEIDDQVATRIERARVLQAPTPPLLWAILDESVIRRPVGGPAVMREQLTHIAELAHRSRVLVQVLPYSVGAHAMLESMVSLMTFTDAPDVAYVEGLQTGQLLDSPALVARCRLSYDLARAAALPPEASLALIESAAEDFTDEREA